MAKVIDALVVTLGLDPSGYKKGAAEANAAQAGLKNTAQADAKATQASTEKSGDNTKKLGIERRKQDTEERKRQRQRDREAREQQAQEAKHTEASIDRLKSIGLAAAGAVLGFNTIKGAIQAYVGATNQLANLGRIAPTIGVEVQGLDKLGDAYKQVGGSAEDAATDVAKLAHAQFSYAIHAPDALAGQLRNLGVNPFDEKNQAKDKLHLEQEIADAIKGKTKDLQTQAMYAREIGMSEAFVQLYLVKQSSERAKIFEDADKTAKATAAAAAAAQAQEQSWARLKNHLKGVGENIVATVSPGVTEVLNAVVDTGASATPFKRSGIDPRAALDPRAAKFSAAFAAAEKRHGLQPGTLATIARQESRFNPSAVSKSGAVGLMQLMPKTFPGAGVNVDADIETAAKEIERLINVGKTRKLSPQQTLRYALDAYNGGQGKIDARIAAANAGVVAVNPLKSETSNYLPNIGSPYADFAARNTTPSLPLNDSGSGVNGPITNTHIETVNIHTRATDAAGIAATLPDAIKRQNLVAQANSGLN